MNERSGLKCVLGFSDTETVKLDFDRTPFKTARYWALRTMKWFKLRGFVMLKSSRRCYHVVFDREVSWSLNVRVMAWVSLLSQNRWLEKWFVMQCIKGCSTLRVSPKRSKGGVVPSPRVVFRHGCQENQIEAFMVYRRLIKRFLRELVSGFDWSGVGTNQKQRT